MSKLSHLSCFFLQKFHQIQPSPHPHHLHPALKFPSIPTRSLQPLPSTQLIWLASSTASTTKELIHFKNQHHSIPAFFFLLQLLAPRILQCWTWQVLWLCTRGGLGPLSHSSPFLTQATEIISCAGRGWRRAPIKHSHSSNASMATTGCLCPHRQRGPAHDTMPTPTQTGLSPHCLLLFHIFPVSILPSLHCPNMGMCLRSSSWQPVFSLLLLLWQPKMAWNETPGHPGGRAAAATAPTEPAWAV